VYLSPAFSYKGQLNNDSLYNDLLYSDALDDKSRRFVEGSNIYTLLKTVNQLTGKTE